MDEAVLPCGNVTDADRALLHRIGAGLPLLADLSRSDLLVLCAGCDRQACVVFHAGPHSVPPIYTRSMVGEPWPLDQNPALARLLRQGGSPYRAQAATPEGGALFEEAHPIRNPAGRILGVLLSRKALIQYARDQRRNKFFRQGLEMLREEVLAGEAPDSGHLSPFEEHDGVLFVDARQQILYASGIATNLYRKIGYTRNLMGVSLEDLQTRDATLVSQAMEQNACLEEEVEEGLRIWIQKAIPLKGRRAIGPGLRQSLQPPAREPFLVGGFLLIHDATEARRKEQELKLKSAMLQEIQHRVRNSLQTLIALLRMEARRASTEEARKVLNESISRILSVAAVHDSLVRVETDVVNLRTLSQYILEQTEQSLVDKSQHIELCLEGPDIDLPAEQATPCALVINESVLNALEHGGYGPDQSGTIAVILREAGNLVTIEIHNDGAQLPEGFDMQKDGQLGLRLVRSLVEDGLDGKFELRNDDGVTAVGQFVKRHVDSK